MRLQVPQSRVVHNPRLEIREIAEPFEDEWPGDEFDWRAISEFVSGAAEYDPLCGRAFGAMDPFVMDGIPHQPQKVHECTVVGWELKVGTEQAAVDATVIATSMIGGQWVERP